MHFKIMMMKPGSAKAATTPKRMAHPLPGAHDPDITEEN